MDRTFVLHRGRRLSHFAGSDYFRLSWHPAVRAATVRGIGESGVGAGASRMTTGNLPVYAELERDLSHYFGAGSATLTSAGYTAPLVAAQALAGRFTHALIDERAHGCLQDAATWLGCPVIRFRHRAPTGLREAACGCGRRARLVVLSDGLFTHDGAVAPLAEYIEVLPRGAMLLVDDAHGAGVLGARGRGTVEASGLAVDDVVLTITLSKAFGAYGGAVLGPAWLRKAIVDRSRIFTGNTPPPPPLAWSAIAALKVLRREGSRMRRRLAENLELAGATIERGPDGEPLPRGPMFCVAPATPAARDRLRHLLLEAGIYPPLIRYPNGPAAEYFRFAVSSEHSREQLTSLREALQTFQGTQRRGKRSPASDGATRILPP